MEEQEERLKGSSKRDRVMEESKPYILCIFANLCFAGYNIISKVALDKGMSRYVLVVYGHAFGALATAIFAFLFERKNESKINLPILRNVFFLGLLGGVLGRTFYYMGLEYTSPTFASAMGNMIPSITFILAVFCRMEKLDISKPSTQAKIGGTLVAFAGATLMTLYKGISVITTHTKSSHQTAATSKSSTYADWIKGSIVLTVSFCSLAAFYILQTSTIKMYPAPITLTSFTCLSGTLLSTIMAAILDHKASSWKLSWNTLLAPMYSGIVIFGITVYVQTLVVRTKGPVFMTAFRPLATISVAIMGVLLIGEAIYLGSILGAFLIVLGLYATLWGKQKQKQKNSMDHGIQQANQINLETLVEEEVEELSVPRGGPLYVENLTSVPLFQSSILHELQDLEVELASGSSQVVDEQDISVDELKILSEEDLVDMAIKEVLKDHECVPNPSPVPEEPYSERIAEDPQTSDGKSCNKQSRKRKGMKDDEDSSKLSSLPEEPSCERKGDNPETSILKHYITYSRRKRRILKDDEDALNALPLSKERTADDPQKSIITSCKGKEVKANHLAIKDDDDSPNPLSTPVEPSNKRRADDPDPSYHEICARKSRKRKGMKANNHALERNDMDKKAFWSQIAKKVEYIKKIKEKQGEDKAAVTLHSFNRSVKIKGRASASSGKVERMKPLRSASSAVKVKLSSIQGCIPVHHPEVALSIEVYHNVRSWVKTQEFLVLGQQTLTELRDKIYCLTDKVMEKDGQSNRSGYFLIEDTFYNDLRDPSTIDYSESILDWLRNSRDDALKKWECILAGKMQKKKKAVVGDITGSKLPGFQAADMHRTQFCNLKFQLGAGYLYCHQGDCRHTVVIRDMRLLHPEDIQNRAAYPILLFQVKLHVQKCKVCRIYRATKMTVNDKWAPVNPCYFCDNCYFLLHYTKDGSLQYEDFEVHDYHHDQPR